MNMDFSHKLYYRLPLYFQNKLISLYGFYTKRQRHGIIFQEQLKKIYEREQWSLDRICLYQLKKTKEILNHAKAHVPFYRRCFREIGLDTEDIKSIEDLKILPVISKQMVRQNPKDFIDERLNIKRLIHAPTSGTTGTPLDIYWDTFTNQSVWAYMEARVRNWAGVKMGDPHVLLTGRMIVPQDQCRPPFWRYNRPWKQLYMSSYHLSPNYLDSYLEAIEHFRPVYIQGYPSSIYAIASHTIRKGYRQIEVKAVLTSSETLFDHMRETIEKAFSTEVFDGYSGAEVIGMLSECEHHRLHISPDYGVIEFLDENGKPQTSGKQGRLVCTGLLNKAMPFIRYETGDLASPSNGKCPCGRQFPVVEKIFGRDDDLIRTKDGKEIGRLDHVFKGVDRIIEAQIIQENFKKIRIKIIPANGYHEEQGQQIIKNIRERVGDAQYIIEKVESIPRTKQGKLRAVISHLKQQPLKKAKYNKQEYQ